MKKVENWEQVQELGSGIKAGIYICQIVDVENVEDKNYLKVYFEIIEGDFKHYFSNKQEVDKKWPFNGAFIRSYKDSALSYFKSFITAVEKSNPRFVWAWDEKELEDKTIVVVMGEEEYLDGNEVKISVKPVEVRSLVALKEGKIKVPEIKRIKVEEKPTVEKIKDEDLPF